jgi:hypothetical protein
VEVPQEEIIGNHAPGEEHSKGKEESDGASVGKVFARQRVGTDKSYGYIDEGTKDSIKNCVPVAHGNSGIFKYCLIALKAGFNRQESYLPGRNGIRGRERSRNNENYRVKDTY